MTIEQDSEFITDEEWRELAALMMKKYAHYLGDKCFTVSGEFSDQGIYVTVLLANPDESYYYPVEARIDHVAEELLPKQAAFFLIDYIDSYFEEYLTEDDNLLITIDWSLHEYEAINFQMRGQIYNRKVERMADELLAQHAKN